MNLYELDVEARILDGIAEGWIWFEHYPAHSKEDMPTDEYTQQLAKDNLFVIALISKHYDIILAHLMGGRWKLAGRRGV